MALPDKWSIPLALGFSVFPLRANGKKPAVKKWKPYRFDLARPYELEEWATGPFNVAIATGALSGIWVLDEDSETAGTMLAVLGEIPPTLTVRTPRARHRYFKHPGYPITNRAGVISGIDARGDGGYVVAPGSYFIPDPEEAAKGKVPGAYVWETDPHHPIAEAPKWLLDYVTKPAVPERPDIEVVSADHTSPYGAKALRAECAELMIAEEGTRNDKLNKHAFRIFQLVAGGEIEREDAWQALTDAAMTTGLEDREIATVLGRALTDGAKHPRAHANPFEVAGVPVLPPGASSVPLPPTTTGEAAVTIPETLPPILTAWHQEQYFRGCTWIADSNRVWTGKGIYDRERFNVLYGGHRFALNADGSGTPSKAAWEGFTQSTVNRASKVDGTCFRPELTSGAIVEEENRRLVNIWIPIETRRLSGDPGPFLRCLEKILPVEHDRAIILAYMASLVQNPGVKFQWWPVIQGAEGNGKSLLLRALMHAVGRRYTHLPNAPDLARNGLKFNGWVEGNLLCGIEEIRLANKRDFLEEFKPIVTNDRVPIERKGIDEVTGDNRLNGLLFTNHKDGVPVTVDGRRYAIFYTAQQSKADKIRDGMGGGYFPDLYDWCYGRRAYASGGANYGFAIVADWLARYLVPAELDPANACVEAPATSSTGAAVAASLGKAEQEVLEAIDEGRAGFAGGWVSSLFLDNLLNSIRASVPRTKRGEMMRTLGYVLHEALPDGRTKGVVDPDGRKPRLYLKIGHPAHGLTESLAVEKAYSEAQKPAMNYYSSTVVPFTRPT